MLVQRILCPISLSEKSDEALRYSLTLAKAYEAKVFIFHCTLGSAKGMLNEAEQVLDARIRIKQKIAETVTGSFDQALIAASEWELALSDCEDPGVAIVTEASKRNADLIVMSSRRRPHRAALLGSTAEEVCRTASCPVLVTHPKERDWFENNEISLKRVLVAYDFSDFSELALNYGLSLAQEYQADLHLLHVLPSANVEPETSWYPLGQEGAYHIAARRLQKTVPSEAHLWCDVRHVVSEGQPFREILNYAETYKTDLICIGAHGAGFGMRTLFGSNVDRVLRQAPCPVLVARPLKPANGTKTTLSVGIRERGSGITPHRAAS